MTMGDEGEVQEAEQVSRSSIPDCKNCRWYAAKWRKNARIADDVCNYPPLWKNIDDSKHVVSATKSRAYDHYCGLAGRYFEHKDTGKPWKVPKESPLWKRWSRRTWGIIALAVWLGVVVTVVRGNLFG